MFISLFISNLAAQITISSLQMYSAGFGLLFLLLITISVLVLGTAVSSKIFFQTVSSPGNLDGKIESNAIYFNGFRMEYEEKLAKAIKDFFQSMDD